MSFKIKIGKDRKPWLEDPNTGYKVKKRMKHVIQNPLLPQNRVTIRLEVLETGEQVFQVHVHSTHKADLSQVAFIRPSLCANHKELIYKTMVGAGAAAEHLCEMYGDLLDPDKCATEAQKVLREFCIQLAKEEEVPKAIID